MVAFAIVLEILLPTVVLGCFRRRKYMEMLAIKIIRSILTLPFLFWVVQAHLTIIKMINDMILSGYFLQDRTIVFGGAFDQPGLFKQGVLMFSERSEGRAKRGDSPKGRAGCERGDPNAGKLLQSALVCGRCGWRSSRASDHGFYGIIRS